MIVKNLAQDFMSLAKVVLLSKGGSSFEPVGKGRELIILGNGPSLRETIDQKSEWLMLNDLMTVNFAANTPEFFNLRPRFHVLADGHFFNGVSSDDNVALLWQNLKRVSWDLTLLLPSKYRHLVKPLLIDAPGLKVKFFHLTPVEGTKFFSHFLISSKLGMPRPRNVMIPAILCGIWMNYKKIYLTGADHTWTKTLDVTEDNRVISVQPHYYRDNDKEKKRVDKTYRNIRLHQVLESVARAFRSYWEIARYADAKGITIINATPSSMIDAFPRLSQ